ncbi:MAG: inorganic diphosphatase [Gaiellaceae bacterium]
MDSPSTQGEVLVFIEIPRGSRNKYEYDFARGDIVLDRRLFTSTVYPADYGFIEGTLAEDGDPLDALVLAGDPTFPGCVIRGRAVGLFRMIDEKGPDNKLMCVPLRDPLWANVRDADDIPAALRAEIEQFFKVYKELEGERTHTAGFGSRPEALQVLGEAVARHNQASRDPDTRAEISA